MKLLRLQERDTIHEYCRDCTVPGAAMLSFRLWTIFYVFALLAAAMATFGASGLLVGVFIFVFWTTISVSASPGRTVLAWCVGICLILATLAFFLPALSKAREAARRNQCFGQLKQLAVALQSHHNNKGILPPAYIEAADGKRILGWRHMLLPFMEEQPLFNRIDQSKAWDDPANFPATATQLSRFHCPSCNLGPTTTEYVVAVGLQTAWPGATGRKFQDFSDGIASTILVIEAHGRSVNWAAPSDLTFDEAVELL
jgi:hypothetical protein